MSSVFQGNITLDPRVRTTHVDDPDDAPVAGHWRGLAMAPNGSFLISTGPSASISYSAGLPVGGTGVILVVGASAVDHWAPGGAPMSADGRLIMSNADGTYAHQGVPYLDSLIAAFVEAYVPAPPVWSIIPPQFADDIDLPLPDEFDPDPYVYSLDPLGSWTLDVVPPEPGFSIDSVTGLISLADGIPPGTYSLTITVTSVGGTEASDPFDYIIVEVGVPVWSPIPNYDHLFSAVGNDRRYSLAPYAGGPAPIESYGLTAPPAGFSINTSNGQITCAPGTAVAIYTLNVTATSAAGTTPSSFDWEVLRDPTPPDWHTPIPDQSHGDDELPLVDFLDCNTYVSSLDGALFNWTLVPVIPEFTINSSGVISVGVDALETTHTMLVRVENSVDTADSNQFDWIISDVLVPPDWGVTPIAPRDTDEHLLPDDSPGYDVSTYVSTNAGPITTWSISVSPPEAGFAITQAGIITAAAGIAPGPYGITVTCRNDEGFASSDPFIWTINATFTAPTWSPPNAPIGNQTDRQNDLPESLDITGNVTSNHGSRTGWRITVSPPQPLISISGGVITVEAGTSEDVYSIQAFVSNLSGESGSNTFTWTITELETAPDWAPTIPDYVIGEDLLPDANLDMKTYVTTNAGDFIGWALVPPTAGFTISGGATGGVVTAAGGTSPQTYPFEVDVTNNEGTTRSPSFDYIINAVFAPPDWHTPVPTQNSRVNDSPVMLDMKDYVSTNAGLLDTWGILPSEPAGFAIDSNGILTVTGTSVIEGTYPIQITVSNDEGPNLSNLFNWIIGEELVVPTWLTVADTSTRINLLPAPYNVESRVISNDGTPFNYTLVGEPAGFTIADPAEGIITAADTLTEGTYSMQVTCENNTGVSLPSNEFDWEILEELLSPQWGDPTQIPDRTDNETALPLTFLATAHVTTNSGSLRGWALTPVIFGFDIEDENDAVPGRVTCSPGVALGPHQMQVSVTNDTGTELSRLFTWTIEEELLPPQWIIPPGVPPRVTPEGSLPDYYDLNPYITPQPEAGPLRNWLIVNPQTGFSFPSDDGILEAALGTSAGEYAILIRVENNIDYADSNVFSWEITSTAPTEYLHNFTDCDVDVWTFSRTSEQQAWDNVGTLRTVAAGIPAYPGGVWTGSAFVADPNCEGILIEGRATNVVNYSNDMDHAEWGTSNMTVDANNEMTSTGSNAYVQQTDIGES